MLSLSNSTRAHATQIVRVALGAALIAMASSVWAQRPNVLIAISDDQSYPHASAYGEPVISTPAFDSVARSGILFRNAFTPCPGCSPMRAAFLTGQHVWQIRNAGTHASSFPRDLHCFTRDLNAEGYSIGYTGKPWGPGNWKEDGWEENPVGPAFNDAKLTPPKGISGTDYATNFHQFLDDRDESEPFCFWYGGHEPHRVFGKGLGAKGGMDPDKVNVPAFLPDSDEIRNDLLDYFGEIQWFDSHLGRMLDDLRSRGLLDNTLVIVTSDNGMSFPRAKANLYEYGIHMPLAISWPAGIQGDQRIEDSLVSLIDVTATIYDVCGVAAKQPLAGRSISPIFSGANEPPRQAVYAGRERHSSSRYNSLGYPCRCIRTADYLYIRNFAPERWPAGTPQKFNAVKYDRDLKPVQVELGPEHGGYHDIDACPTLSWMIANRSADAVAELFQAAVGKRPQEELYAVGTDPGCLTNLASDPAYADRLAELRGLLTQELTVTADLRQVSPESADAWENYPRYSALRWFPQPAWAVAEPEKVPEQAWLEKRRPKVEN